MSLILEYRNTRGDYLAHYELVSGDAYRSARLAYYKSIAFWSGVLVLASYVAFQGDQIFAMCVFIGIGGWTLIRSLPYSRRYWSAVERSLSSRPENQIRLEVREDGLHEAIDGIDSFVPWSSVKSFTVFRNTLFIKLAAGLWAIIPRSSLTASPAGVDDLIRVLRDKGIKESPNPTVHPRIG